jgi:RsiW-degrading membrane proteinase PrsW (M82 family)
MSLGSLAFGLLFFGSISAGWMAYFRWKDQKRPEPLWLLVATLAGGAGSVVAAVLGYSAAGTLGAHADWAYLSHASFPQAWMMAMLIGVVEEAAKMLPVVPIAMWSRHFDEPLDGIIYAACAGIGFSVTESAALFAGGEFGLGEGLFRALVAPITHALFAAPWGLGLAAWVFRRDARALGMGFAIAATCHAMYDLLLARPGLPLVGSAMIVLGLWVWLIRTGQRLAQVPPRPRT